MHVEEYTVHIEAAVSSERALERLRCAVVADDTLTEDQCYELDGTIGGYLADIDRALEPTGGWGPDSAPEEIPSVGERRRRLVLSRPHNPE